MAENQGSPISARAIVAYDPIDGKPNLKLQDVTFRALGPNEVLVKLVATGYCHTDLVFSSVGPEMGPYPKVLGHEGWWPSRDLQTPRSSNFSVLTSA